MSLLPNPIASNSKITAISNKIILADDPPQEYMDGIGEFEMGTNSAKEKILESSLVPNTGSDRTPSIYCSRKLRLGLARALYGRNDFGNRSWSKIRNLAMAVGAREITNKKHVDSLSAEYLFFVCVYIRYRDMRYIPKTTEKFAERFNQWGDRELPHIKRISIYRTIGEGETLVSVNLLTPWFLDDSTQSIHLIDYGKLCELLAKTFYGYIPTPQFISSLGLKNPKKRKYSFTDFKLIRDRVIKSRRAQNRQCNHILFEKI